MKMAAKGWQISFATFFHNKVTDVLGACTLVLINLFITCMISDSTISFINILD